MLQTLLTKTILRTTDNYIKSLQKVWINTVQDFINLYPRDYEDRTNILDSFSFINIKDKNTILVTLISIENTNTNNWKTLTKAIVEDKNWFMCECVWFNRKFLTTQYQKFIQKKVILSWKVKYDFWKLSFLSPEIEGDLSKLSWEVLPIYSDVNYIPWSWIQSKMENVKNYIKYFPETLPKKIIDKYNFISKVDALYLLHFPKNKTDIEIAKYRLAYEELFEINFKSISKKHNIFKTTTWKSIPISLDAELIKKIISKLPFELTWWQKIALFQILKDSELNHSMQRLLEWDVWTWKTIVAAVWIIHNILQARKIYGEKSFQVAIMAPTEILARQHFEGLLNMFFEYWISCELLVGSTTAKNKEIIKQKLKSWDIDVIIWTHALIQEDVLFKNLFFVIIDEQHRFWVKQREVLESWIWNSSWVIPHNLNMTATPIPRTLALTLYWDQDLSIISEYPKDRKIIHTKVIWSDEARNQVELFIRSQLESWRQVFWISPLVEESEKMDLANAISTFESLVDIFSPFQVWLLHWKMKPKEKDQIMKDFSENKIQILSSTSVVEVWVNIPNASIMCIEWAERFWLSQLHQFRWRVWRWKYQSYCYLFPTTWKSTDRLKAMEKTNNWFELSEIDLELRGPWEVYWVRQSWVPEFKIADLKDLELVSQIREDIEELLK